MADFSLKGTLDLNTRSFVKGADKATDAIEDTEQALESTGDASDDLAAKFDRLEQEAAGLASDLDDINDVRIDPDVDTGGLDRARASADDVAETAQRGVGPLRGFTDELGEGAAAGGVMGAAVTDAGEAVQIYGQQLGISTKATARFATATGVAGVAIIGLTVLWSKMQESRAAARAFETEQIESFTEAILDGADAVETLTGKWEDQGGVLLNLGNPTANVTKELNQLGVSSFQASQLVEGGVTAVEDWREAMEDAGIPTRRFGASYFALKDAAEAYATAQEDANVQTEFFGTDAEQAAAELANFSGGLDVAVQDLEAFGETGAEATSIVQQGFELLRGSIDIEQELRRLSSQFSTTMGNIGSDTQASRDDVLDMKETVLDFAAAAGDVPEEVVTDLLAQIDEGAYGEVEARLFVLSRMREVTVQVVADLSRVPQNVRGQIRHRGGPVEPGVPYTVGTAGHEELFIPNQRGRILSHGKTERAMSGMGDATVNVYLDGQLVRGVARVEIEQSHTHAGMVA